MGKWNTAALCIDWYITSLIHLPTTVGIKGSHFGSWHFQIHFSNEWKWCNSNFTEICSQASNWQYASIGSGCGLAPNSRQTITWTNKEPMCWRKCAAQGAAISWTSINLPWFAIFVLIKSPWPGWVFNYLHMRMSTTNFDLWSVRSVTIMWWKFNNSH